jgi:septal ring factor EnvC (AmiA/AmiB activator)
VAGLAVTELDETSRFCLQAFVDAQLGQQNRFRMFRASSGSRARVAWLVMALAAAGCLGWASMVSREQAQLNQRLVKRTVMVSQFEARQATLEQELGEAKKVALGFLSEINRLQDQTSQVMAEMSHLTEEFGALQHAYARIQDERERLRARLMEIEQEQRRLNRRFDDKAITVPGLPPTGSSAAP